MNSIYLDNNSTTPVLPEVRQAMAPFWDQDFGNPASAHACGRRARRALEDAREQIADLLGARSDEVLFTSGATEANNLALLGLESGGRVLVSPVEHPSVTEPARQLADCQCLRVDREGTIDVEDFRAQLARDVRLVSVQLANHETGTVQPIRDLADMSDALFHCDAVQAVGKMAVNFQELGVSTMSASAHKFHGPQGMGLLIVRQGVKLKPRSWGGHQQQGKRPGTEPVALAVGMAKALEMWHLGRDARTAHVRVLRRVFLDRLRESAGPIAVHGHAEGLPHTINVSFPGCQSDSLLMNLDLAGVACSTGSACSSGSLLPSPVLQAMGVPDAELRSAMRFSMSFLLSEDEVLEAARRVSQCVQRLRSLES